MSTAPTFETELIDLMPALGSFSRSLCRRQEDAEDLVQGTVAKALKNRSNYENYGVLKSWPFTIMKNTFCSNFRRSGRECQLSDDYELAIAPSQDSTMELQDVRHSFRDLPENARVVIKLVVLDGLQYGEAAIQLGCSIGTVKSRLHRARLKLGEKAILPMQA